MEIKFNHDLNAASRPASVGPKPVLENARNVAPAFVAAEALNQALAATPDARTDEVARARLLIADEHYPPDVMVQRIARLLAWEWEPGE